MNTKILEINKLSKSFNNGKVIALNNITYSLEKGKIVSIVGESGSGKTTLIRLISGLEVLNNGEIKLNQKVVSSKSIFIEPEKRNVGMVFQDYALFPHLTVFQNVVYGISKKSDKKERVSEVLSLVGLEGMNTRYPHELSGGQQQRVALARALAPKPELLILDEPFSNLDVVLRNQLRKDLHQILKKTNCTAIFVTHDIKDAIAISDEIIVLQKGVVLEQGKTKKVFKESTNEYVRLLLDSI
ncbi:iron(III) transport system ATP-binding protein [Tenacibaculum sp. MAR_2010_89]|uniref:ABC transporter ATP-binding protein n=1 Tax=Tenacibaculum sp. MAR_2010_89 TaxID=1250198 RepID=UPI0008972B86|nr:ABC transporter ATP-binding protein [Tenacibaculum sp. MAR_2010_89]SEE54285.1 iron(III) transport system ATP-binding protein [Tenacibaculum sp. MAR_2010_89]